MRPALPLLFQRQLFKVDSSMFKITRLHFSCNKSFGLFWWVKSKQCWFQVRQLVTSWLAWISIVCKNLNIAFGAERVKGKEDITYNAYYFIFFAPCILLLLLYKLHLFFVTVDTMMEFNMCRHMFGRSRMNPMMVMMYCNSRAA